MTQDPSVRAAIAALGTSLGPEVLQRCATLFAAEQLRLAVGSAPTAVDLAYGSHPRQRLDFYAPAGGAGAAPVFVWVHGGGFMRGEKSSPDHPFNAHVGRWAARNGFLGVVINYRLVPDAAWPTGGEDVGRVVDWLKANVARHGGDPDRIVLAGTSAGSVHVATCLQLRPQHQDVRGVVLLSGLYGVTPPEAADSRYFGEDPRSYAERASLSAVASSQLPMFVACAEFDPARFQAESLALLQATHGVRGRLPRAHFASGHNHYTMAMHLGGADTRLSDEIMAFATEITR